jgi:hypothetical protein
VHDIADLEGRGVPSVFIASAEFVEAAASQSKSLGFPALGVYVAHPIQDRTDDELRDLADGAVDQIVAAVTAPSPTTERT